MFWDNSIEVITYNLLDTILYMMEGTKPNATVQIFVSYRLKKTRISKLKKLNVKRMSRKKSKLPDKCNTANIRID